MQSKQPSQSEEGSSFDLSSFSRPDLTGHQWRQQGTMLICQSCTFTHTSAITDKDGNPAVDYQLYGIDDKGMPMFRKLEF